MYQHILLLKKQHQDGGDRLEILDKPVVHKKIPSKVHVKPVKKDPVLVSDSHSSELVIVGVLSVGAGVLRLHSKSSLTLTLKE